MIDLKEEKWLKAALKECFKDNNHRFSKDRKLLEGFSMLVRFTAKNMESKLSEIRELWQKDPTSAELQEKFETLQRNLQYLERYCREKIGREIK